MWIVKTQVPQPYETKEWDSCQRVSQLKNILEGCKLGEHGEWIWVFSDLLKAEEGKKYIETRNINTSMKLTTMKD